VVSFRDLIQGSLMYVVSDKDIMRIKRRIYWVSYHVEVLKLRTFRRNMGRSDEMYRVGFMETYDASGSREGGGFPDQLRDYLLLKEALLRVVS
jgi:hypothetical protein